MALNTKIKSKEVRFKPIMLHIMAITFGISFFNGVFAKAFDPLLFITVIGSFGLGTPLTYYFMNHRSFGSMAFDKFVLAMFF